MKQIALIGAGGFAKEVAEVAQLTGYEVVACYSAEPGNFASIHRGYLDELAREKAEYAGVALAVGAYDRRSLKRRRALIEWIDEREISAIPMVAPTAILAEGVVVERGAFVGHGVTLGVDARVRAFSLINMGAIIGHDAIIGERVVVAPGAFIGGASSVGSDTIVGPLAKVLQGISIGADVMLGIGCLALRSLPDGSTVWPRPERTT
jgi:sugar O-acyltransferase (sialic acid O-acetyltransferase NeuD family)